MILAVCCPYDSGNLPIPALQARESNKGEYEGEGDEGGTRRGYMVVRGAQTRAIVNTKVKRSALVSLFRYAATNYVHQDSNVSCIGVDKP